MVSFVSVFRFMKTGFNYCVLRRSPTSCASESVIEMRPWRVAQRVQMHLRKVAIWLAVVEHGGTHLVVAFRPVVAALANVRTFCASATRSVAWADAKEVVAMLVEERLGSACAHLFDV